MSFLMKLKRTYRENTCKHKVGYTHTPKPKPNKPFVRHVHCGKCHKILESEVLE